MPSASKAAFCMPGERLRETGSPSRSTESGMGEVLELGKEVWIRDGDAIGALDRGRTGRDESRHRQGHRDAVVPVRIDGRAMQRGRPLDADAVRALLHEGAHSAKALSHG